MKKSLFGALVCLAFAACGDDTPSPADNGGNADIDVNIDIPAFSDDPATDVPSRSAIPYIEQIIDGCADIANEVGTAKIGEPYDFYQNGRTAEALYAVESWFSWHSIDDYSNNIVSIRDAFYGSRDGSVSDKSLCAAVNDIDPALARSVVNAIEAAWEGIQNIPSPLRNHIVCAETEAAMSRCDNLEKVLNNQLKPCVTGGRLSERVMTQIVSNYVDVVVLPTYAQLQSRVLALSASVDAFRASPDDKAFEACADAWLSAREPWERSEAFLFGPVADMGLDPNMDSWPLDVDAIVGVLNSQNWSGMEWGGDYDEDSEAIAAAQNVRGFHTLEFLIFKDGRPRVVTGDVASGTYDLDYTPANASSWANYMTNVARLLVADAARLNAEWVESYADKFKGHTAL